MRKVVKKKTKKFIAVVVAAAMVLASGIAVPVKAASDVTEGKSVEELPVLELDKPVTVTKEKAVRPFWLILIIGSILISRMVLGLLIALSNQPNIM